MKYTPERVTKLPRNHRFVFGSNLAGRHGKGAAKDAVDYFGAEYGVGYGATGRCWAIPTKDRKLRTLDIHKIGYHIMAFLWFAHVNKHMTYVVTKIGCGLAGYSEDEIKRWFRNAPDNVILPKGWRYEKTRL